MNKTVMIFAAAMASVCTVPAVDLVGVNLVGDPGEPATNISSVATLNILSSRFSGGSFVTNTSSAFAVNGNAGIEITDAASISISDSVFVGSRGGNGEAGAAETRAQSLGGRGIDLRGLFSIDPLQSGVTATGGSGGAIVSTGGGGRAYGGDGLYINTTATYDLIIDGGAYTGGSGGNANFNSAEVNDPNDGNNGANYLGDFFGTIGGVLGARGGYGLRVYNEDFLFTGTTITVNDGTFRGGNGGVSENTNPDGDSNADGGHGIFTDFVDIEINGGDFYGGSAGTANGARGEAGFGLKMRDGSLIVTDGNFYNQGLWFESHYYDSLAVISGGTFGHAVFVARYDEFFADPNRTTTAVITWGVFDRVTFMSEGENTAFNNATISDAVIGDLHFSGSVADSAATVSLDPSVTVSGSVQQNGGIVNVEQWSDSHFANTTIADGTMNFNNRMFNLDGLFELQNSTAEANFNNGLTVQGGTLTLGLGTVTAPSVLIEGGSQINTEYIGGSNSVLGAVSSTGDLMIESGAQWNIAAGTNAVAVDDTFDLATAAGTITSDIDAGDVSFSGIAGEGGWLSGINELEVIGNVLRATYGSREIDEAAGVAGDTSTEFGKAMADLSRLVQPGSPGYDFLGNLTFSQAVGTAVMANGYVRTTEMANTLVSLQSIFSDQIKDRTRSFLRDQEVGYPAASAPTGSAGWEAMRTFSDRMESSFGSEQVKGMVDAATPDVELDVMGTLNSVTPDVRIERVNLPPAYRTWGRGYGSFIDQDASGESPGYEATIGGGVLGIDRQINNVLLGLAGGYARTDVDGDVNKDGTSDTGHVAAYFSAHGDRLFLDANANYAFNSVETEYETLDYEGDYDAHTVGLYLGGGYVITIAERILLTPEASILSTFYSRDSYTEKSPLLPNLNWDSYDEWSHLSTLGATLSMIQKVDFNDAEIAVQPEVRAHWLHEFNDEFDDEEYKMTGGLYTVAATLQAREEDLFKVGAGVRLSKWDTDTTAIGLDFDGIYGDDYDAYIISGKIMHRF
jgi:hypothetical protein